MKHLLFATAGIFALMAPGSSAQAQNSGTICGQRDLIINTVTGQFGETPRSWGMGPGNQIIEVFASEETGTWTITVTAPSGRTCLVAAGQYWEDLAAMPVGDPL